MRISDWSSDVCSSDLSPGLSVARRTGGPKTRLHAMPTGHGDTYKAALFLADVAPPAFEYQLFAAAKRPATGAAGRHCLHPRVFRTVPPGRHPARKRGTCCRALKQLKQRSRRGRVGAIAAAENLAGINLFVGQIGRAHV